MHVIFKSPSFDYQFREKFKKTRLQMRKGQFLPLNVVLERLISLPNAVQYIMTLQISLQK